jgi:hypothetical protein
MGGVASISPTSSLPDRVDESTCQLFLGTQFDAEAWASAPKYSDGTVSREDLLLAVLSSSGGGEDSGALSTTPTDVAPCADWSCDPSSAREITDVADRAVSLSFLKKFCLTHGAWEMPTSDVVEKIVRPRTRSPCSYSELLPAEHTGRTNIFVSHAWKQPFGLLLAALTRFCGVEDEDDDDDDTTSSKKKKKKKKKKQLRREREKKMLACKVWLDVFAIRQHAPAADLSQLHAIVASAPNFVIVMDTNATPLSRAWCVYEIVAWLADDKKDAGDGVETGSSAATKPIAKKTTKKKQMNKTRRWDAMHTLSGTCVPLMGPSLMGRTGGDGSAPAPIGANDGREVDVEEASGGDEEDVVVGVRFMPAEKGQMDALFKSADVANAEATFAADREMIFRGLNSQVRGGVAEVNRVVRRAVMQATVATQLEMAGSGFKTTTAKKKAMMVTGGGASDAGGKRIGMKVLSSMYKSLEM